MSAETSRDRILRELRDTRGWRCGAAWYASFLPTFSQRISEINADEPGRILSRPCHQEGHQHRGGIHEYALAKYAQAEQLTLSA